MTRSKNQYVWFFIFITIFLTSCQSGENMTGQYFDFIVEDTQLFSEGNISDSQWLSVYFAGEEPTLLYSEPRTDAYGQVSLDIQQQQPDGTQILLAQNIDPLYQAADWYPDDTGCFYLALSGSIIKVTADGKELFCTKAQKTIQDLCLLPDGRILLLLRAMNGMELAWLDAETGQLSAAANLPISEDTLKLSWNSTDNVLYLLSRHGITAIDITNRESKQCITFQGTTYMLPLTSIEAFRLPDTDKVELLLADGTREYLEYADIGKKKSILVIRFGPEEDYGYTEGYLSWLKEQTAAFNRANADYHAVFKPYSAEVSLSDYQVMTGVEMAAGRGADIIYGQAVEDNVYGLLEKGVFEDLAPYLEETINREDYFPAAFDCWELDGKVYGIKFSMNLGIGWAVDKSLVEDAAGLTLEDMMDILLAYQGNACYSEFIESELVLRDFLQCSQSLGGAVDWESGTCNFNGGLFSKVLQVSKRYGYSPKDAYPELFTPRSVSGLITYDDSSWLDSQGRTIIDYFFDDGRYLISRKQALLAVNANSPHIEGAWQFISFLLQEEAQTRLMVHGDMPVSKVVFEKAARSQLENGPLSESPYKPSRAAAFWGCSSLERVHYQTQGLSQEEMQKRLWRTHEEIDEIRTAMEYAKPLPLRTMPILEIIYEEASYYYNDVKTLEEVSSMITNRVQLYLDEALP